MPRRLAILPALLLVACGTERSPVPVTPAPLAVPTVVAPAAATATAPTATAASTGEAPLDCDTLVARAGAGTRYDMSERDPECKWRVEEAYDEWSASNRNPPGFVPGKYQTFYSGRTPPERITPLIDKRAAAVENCLAEDRVSDPRGKVRVRIAIDLTGHVTSVVPDYRVPDAFPATACLYDVFAAVTFPKPEEGAPLVLVRDFKVKTARP